MKSVKTSWHWQEKEASPKVQKIEILGNYKHRLPFDAWLREKRRQGGNKEQSLKTEVPHEKKDNKEAFNSWLQRKQKQIAKERQEKAATVTNNNKIRKKREKCLEIPKAARRTPSSKLQLQDNNEKKNPEEDPEVVALRSQKYAAWLERKNAESEKLRQIEKLKTMELQRKKQKEKMLKWKKKDIVMAYSNVVVVAPQTV